AHLLLLAVERDRVRAGALVPECLVDAPRQLDRLARAARGLVTASELPVDARHAPQRIDAIPLYLDERDGRMGRRTVRMRLAVARILPALVLQSVRSLALVLDESVPVLVAVLRDPSQRRLGGGQQLLRGRAVVGPLQV